MLELEFTLSSDDLVAYNLFAVYKLPAGLRELRRYRIWLMLLVAVASFAIVVIGFGKVVAALITASVGALLAVLLAPWLWRRHARSKVLRLARENALGTPGYHRLRVDKEGLTDEGPDGAIGATWDRLQRVEQLSRHLLVFTGLVEAIVIPRTVGDARIADLMRLVEAHRPDLLSVRA